MASFAAVYAVKKREAGKLLRNAKVQGVGVGYLDPKNPKKGAAVILYADALSAASLGIAPTLAPRGQERTGQVPVRLVRAGTIRSHADFRVRVRPVPGGYSIGTSRGSGTLGLVVTNFPGATQRYAFSNNHVLTSPINTGTPAVTLQPGGADGGAVVRDRIGRLNRFVRLTRTGTNRMDAALSLPVRSGILNPRYAGVGVIPGHVTSYRVGEQFKKVGRTTGLVRGTVDSVNTDVNVDYGGQLGVITFRNQTVVVGSVPISLPGDSGSVWLRRADNYAAAVNFAGTETGRISIAFPVDWFMQAFRTRVATPTGAGRVAAVRVPKGSSAYARRLTARELAAIKITRVKRR